jgi:two-component system, LytTR family, sensor kinase
MDRFWKYRLEHVIFWTATVCFHMFTRTTLIETAGLIQFLLEIVLRNSLLAAVIYFNLRFLIPKFAKKNKLMFYTGFLAMSMMGYALIKNAHDVYLYGYILGDETRSYFFYNTFYNLSIAIFYVAFSVALQLSREWFEQRSLIQKIEVDKLNTELEYLKAQINPHFLFNSINTIYFQIDKQNSAARETLSSFSEMLRYQLYECNGKEVSIEKEITYLRNYVDLQKLRKDENYNIVFSCGEDVHGFAIAPLLLIPFVENAFKHVSHHPNGNEIKIELLKDDQFFYLKVLNTREAQLNMDKNGGIGLKNVKRRLELIYNGKHDLRIHELPRSFEINLKLKIE